MRKYPKSLGGLLALAFLVLPFSAAVSHAQQPLTITMTPTLDRGTGLAGTVTVTPAGANQVKVEIRITGLKPNDERASHIHSPGTDTSAGPCDTNGPVVYPLPNVKADASGVGTNSMTVTFDAAKGMPTTGWYFNVHTGAAPNVGVGVICGRITTSLVAAGGAAPAAAAASPAAAAPAAGAAAAPAAPAAAPAGGLPRTGTGGPAPTNGLLIAVLALAGIALASMSFVLSRRS